MKTILKILFQSLKNKMIFSFFNIIKRFNYENKLWFIIIIFFSFQTFAQKADTVKTLVKPADTSKVNVADTNKIKKHSPKKAAIMSACLPGLGQVYNKKYWKVPIIYAGAAAIAYSVIFNTKYYKDYNKAYVGAMNGDTNNYYAKLYSTVDLLTLRNYYRRDLELSYIVGFALYALNIIDASVDAHLYKFDITNDLSLNCSPAFFAYRNHAVTGLTFSFNFSNAKKKQLFFKY